MAKIVKRKSDGKWLNCFQSKGNEKTTTDCTIQNSLTLDDVEIIEVTQEEYKIAVDEYIKDNPPLPKPVENVRCPECGHEFEPSGARL